MRLSKGDQVNVFTDVSDGQGDVTTDWAAGTVIGNVIVSPSFQQAGFGRSGVTIRVPDSAFKDKTVFVEDCDIDLTVAKVSSP